MERSLAAQQGGNLPLGARLARQVIALQPDWVEAWNKRAATRLLGGDLNGAIGDFQQVLKLEPRQFSALVALGFIYEKQGFDKRALDSFRQGAST